MKQEGKFILMNREEFKTYIEGLKNVKKFTNIQQHHTASPSYKDVKNNHIALMKGMENYHVKNFKMSEIAQHFSTFPDGTICVGRPLTKDGGGFLSPGNKDSITIENVGNFDTDVMTEEQKQSIVLLNALLCKKFNIVPSTS
ncbi:MAG: peptidoglycan recognition protein family protein, partial [Ruminiclostridium sp.]